MMSTLQTGNIVFDTSANQGIRYSNKSINFINNNLSNLANVINATIFPSGSYLLSLSATPPTNYIEVTNTTTYSISTYANLANYTPYIDGGSFVTVNTGNIAVNAASLTGIAYGNGIYVAVSSSTNNYIITSNNNLASWTLQTPAVGANLAISVAYGNGYFAVVGGISNATISSAGQVSTDGVNWTKVLGNTNTYGVLTGVSYSPSLNRFVGIAANNSGTTPFAYYGTPGNSAWTLANAFPTSGLGSYYPYCIIWSPFSSTFMVHGDSNSTNGGAAYFSADGITWTSRPYLVNTNINGYDVNIFFRAAAYGNNTVVSVGNGGIIATTTSSNTNGFYPKTSPLSTNLTSVVYSLGYFIASDVNGNTIISSDNGNNWVLSTTTKPTGMINYATVVPDNNMIIAVGNNISGTNSAYIYTNNLYSYDKAVNYKIPPFMDKYFSPYNTGDGTTYIYFKP